MGVEFSSNVEFKKLGLAPEEMVQFFSFLFMRQEVLAKRDFRKHVSTSLKPGLPR
jgi:hypothetical protein